MAAASYADLKPLHCAQFHACRIRRQRQGDVARDRYIGSGGFCGIGVARGCDLHCGWGRQICRRCIDACGRDGSNVRVSPGKAVHTPIHSGVCGVVHGGGERYLVAEHDGAARRRHVHSDGRRRWWRRGDCASSAAAQYPCARREKSEESDSLRPSKVLNDDVRKGPHALRKADEGPAK